MFYLNVMVCVRWFEKDLCSIADGNGWFGAKAYWSGGYFIAGVCWLVNWCSGLWILRADLWNEHAELWIGLDELWLICEWKCDDLQLKRIEMWLMRSDVEIARFDIARICWSVDCLC